MSGTGQPMSGQPRIAAVQKQARALELRVQGLPLQEIADQLGYRQKAGAYKAIRRALQETLVAPAEELRLLELARLDRILAASWDGWTRSLTQTETTTTERLTAGERSSERARIQRSSPAVGDPRFLLVALRTSELRSRLLGLEAPSHVDLTLMLQQAASERGLDAGLVTQAAERLLAEWRR